MWSESITSVLTRVNRGRDPLGGLGEKRRVGGGQSKVRIVEVLGIVSL